MLEDANIKLSSVAADVLGVSGRAMREALIQGEEDPVKLADWAKRKLRGKIPELQKALDGHLTVHHRFLLQLLWKQLDEQQELIDQLDGKIEKKTRPLAAEIDRLDRLPPRPLVSFPLLPCFLASAPALFPASTETARSAQPTPNPTPTRSTR